MSNLQHTNQSLSVSCRSVDISVNNSDDEQIIRRQPSIRETPKELATTIKEIDSMLAFIEESAEQVKEAFANIDKHGKGRISTGTLVTLVRSLGLNPTEEETEDMINEVDADGSGDVDFIEFLQMMKSRWYAVDEAVREAFEMFDQDGSGQIDATEIKQMMEEHGQLEYSEKEVEDIISRVDKNGDGQIDLEEFMEMLKDS